MQDIITLQNEAISAIQNASDMTALEAIRIDYLGKKGKLTELLKGLAHLTSEEKPKVGQLVNQAKREISEHIEAALSHIKEKQLQQQLQEETCDVTLPGRNKIQGTLHPVTMVKQRICEYFTSLGFDIVEGPEVETDFYNFEALNIPSHHPARAMHDTFYFGDGRLLRTHTSPVQIRTMEKRTPPMRLISPGRVYRCDSDMTHTPMFHQVEGLLIDQKTTLAELKGTLHDFFTWFFGKTVDIRFRPSYFPFTEPSAEVDISCTQCNGSGCRSCKFTGWLEVAGCGMVHPNVLNSVNISPNDFQGWAFGVGMDRLAMLYYGIEDLRTLFENDLAFLTQFGH